MGNIVLMFYLFIAVYIFRVAHRAKRDYIPARRF